MPVCCCKANAPATAIWPVQIFDELTRLSAQANATASYLMIVRQIVDGFPSGVVPSHLREELDRRSSRMLAEGVGRFPRTAEELMVGGMRDLATVNRTRLVEALLDMRQRFPSRSNA